MTACALTQSKCVYSTGGLIFSVQRDDDVKTSSSPHTRVKTATARRPTGTLSCPLNAEAPEL